MKKVFLLGMIFFASTFLFAGTKYLTLNVGETATLYADSGSRAVTSASWYSNFPSSVRVTSQGFTSCRIEVVAYKSSSPIIVRCDYYYRVVSGSYSYTASGYTDYQITVIKPSTPSTGANLTISNGVLTSVKLNGATSVTVPSTVTRIGPNAFSNCSALTSVTIPPSVTEVREDAFKGCNNLSSVYISDIGSWCSIYFDNAYGNPLYYADRLYVNGTLVQDLVIPEGVSVINFATFFGFSGLSSVHFPKSLTVIDYSAFYSCTGLSSIVIPEGVIRIENYAFEGCTGLTSISIPSSLITLGNYAFSNCPQLPKDINGLQYESDAMAVLIGVPTSLTGDFVIPNTVRFIHSHAFSACSNLTSITIPDSVTWIGGYAFEKCSSLTSVTIPSSVTEIHDSAFSGCAGLTTVTILEGATTIGDSAFSGCTGLTSVTIPKSVTTIGSSAFSGCTGLTSITIPEGVTAILNSAFSGCTGLTSVTIPKSVTTIGSSAFSGCTGLTSVTIPEGVTTIGYHAFYNCSSLTSVTIPEGVTSIGMEAFAYCSSLTSVTIPEGVIAIGDRAFSYCSSLTLIYFKSKPPSVGSYTFTNVSSSAMGSYLPQYASEWKVVIDSNNKWEGLTMVQKEVATLPEGLSDATGAWLTDELEALGITSGSAVLAEGTTAETLEAARLLGITPSVSLSSSDATVAAESTFEVSEVAVAGNVVSLAVTITVEAGTLPSALSLGGTVKLMVCDSLGGEWTEVTPEPSQITFTRVSENKAKLSVTRNLGSYNFFQVLVK